jgi:hypothetical protein
MSPKRKRHDTPEPAELLDIEALWTALTPEQQREIGVAAIAAGRGSAGHFDRADRGWNWDAAVGEGLRVIGLTIDRAGIKSGRPDLRKLGVRMCRGCGCTDDYGCPDLCCWVELDLCSACGAEQ